MKSQFCLGILMLHCAMAGTMHPEISSPTSIHSSQITSMAETDKYTWFGTDEGAIRINKRTNKLQWITVESTDLPSDKITGIVCASDGRTWIATNKGILFWDNYAFIPITSSNSNLPDDHITALALDKSGNLWIGMLCGGLAKTKGFHFNHYDIPSYQPGNESVASLTVDPQGNIWVGLYRSGLIRINCEKWTYYSPDEIPFVPSNIRYIQQNEYNYVVSTYDQGSYAFDGRSFAQITDDTEGSKLCSVYHNSQRKITIFFCKEACHIYKAGKFIDKVMLENQESSAVSRALHLRLQHL